MKRVLRWMEGAALLGLGAGLLMRPQAAAAGAREGLRLCAQVVIPALFPFLVLSTLAVSLGAAAALGRLLVPAAGPLLGIGRCGCGALALGLLSGYPVGAQTVRGLWESGQLSRGEAERLLAFCNNCGPAFVLSAAGAGVFGSTAMGMLLLAGHWLGTLTVGILFRIFGKTAKKSDTVAPIHVTTLSSALNRAVGQGLRAMGSVCAYTVLFGVVIRLLEEAGALRLLEGVPNGPALARGLLDLTGGVGCLDPRLPGAAELAAALLGWGGMAVLCQTLAVLEGCGLRVRFAVAGKLLHGCCAALWTHVLLLWVPLERPGMATALSAAGHVAAGDVWPWAAAVWGIVWGSWLVFIIIHSGKAGGKRV